MSVAGDDFDVREFHDEILRLGPVPLHVVEVAVYEWIRSKTGQAAQTVVRSSCMTSAAWLFGWGFFIRAAVRLLA